MLQRNKKLGVWGFGVLTHFGSHGRSRVYACRHRLCLALLFANLCLAGPDPVVGCHFLLTLPPKTNKREFPRGPGARERESHSPERVPQSRIGNSNNSKLIEIRKY